MSVTVGQLVGEALRRGSLLKAGNGFCFLSPKPYLKTIAPPPQGFPWQGHPALEPPSQLLLQRIPCPSPFRLPSPPSLWQPSLCPSLLRLPLPSALSPHRIWPAPQLRPLPRPSGSSPCSQPGQPLPAPTGRPSPATAPLTLSSGQSRRQRSPPPPRLRAAFPFPPGSPPRLHPPPRLHTLSLPFPLLFSFLPNAALLLPAFLPHPALPSPLPLLPHSGFPSFSFPLFTSVPSLLPPPQPSSPLPTPSSSLPPSLPPSCSLPSPLRPPSPFPLCLPSRLSLPYPPGPQSLEPLFPSPFQSAPRAPSLVPRLPQAWESVAYGSLWTFSLTLLLPTPASQHTSASLPSLSVATLPISAPH